MALLSKKDVYEKYCIDHRYLKAYIYRKKIIMSGDWIDTDLEVNKRQLDLFAKGTEKRRIKKQKEKEESDRLAAEKEKQKVVIKQNVPTVEKKPSKAKLKKQKKEDDGPIKGYKEPVIPIEEGKEYQPKQLTKEDITKQRIEHARAKFLLDVDDEKKIAELENKQIITQLKKIEISKKRGELIPVEQVQTIISKLSQAFQETYKNKSELLLIDISQKTRMSDSDEAFFKGKIINLINVAHKEAIKESKRGMKALIEETKKLKS